MSTDYGELYMLASLRGNAAIVSRALMRSAAFVHGRNEQFTCQEALTQAYTHQGSHLEGGLLLTQVGFAVVEQICMASDRQEMRLDMADAVAVDLLDAVGDGDLVKAAQNALSYDKFSVCEGVRMLLEGLIHIDQPAVFPQALNESLEAWEGGYISSMSGPLIGQFPRMEALFKRDYARMRTNAAAVPKGFGPQISVEAFGSLW